MVTRSAPTTPTDRPPELVGIQILRGLAALAVVIHHTFEEASAARAGAFGPDWLTTGLAAGVDVFFVISGFIMLYVSFPEGRSALGPATFILRRFARIYPLYWLACLAMIGLGAAGFMRSLDFSPATVLTSLLLIPSDKVLIGVSWTLSYEIYFYLVFAVGLLSGSRGGALLIATALIGLLMLAGATAGVGPIGTFVGSPIVLEFCLGLLLAFAVAKSKTHRLIHPAWALLGFVLMLMAPLVVPHESTTSLPDNARLIAWGVPAFLVVAAFLAIEDRSGRDFRLLRFLGDASYAIYLTHAFVMIAYAKLLKSTSLGELDQTAIVPVVILAATLVGSATHVLAERPLRSGLKSLRFAKPKPSRQIA